MTNEEIVLRRLSKKGRSPLKFDNIYGVSYHDFNYMINTLKNKQDIIDRVREILNLNKHFSTYNIHGRKECYPNARRSAQDIWRIYKYYFGDVDIFSIMRALYILVYKEKLCCTRCCTINKLVFYYDDWMHEVDDYKKGDLGVPIIEWKNIALENK